ncbi:S9 family peptidase [Teredinibacter purpureus]|uniref:S9 family peptidase n=1 Tax=Teredinibacter purpureus TaxID=2731756 RepID=UPI0005F82216|nr:prolyl oligopeptidase family serine peptidase [Teredinibacter purpureus]
MPYPTPKTLSHGSWPSAISADCVAGKTPRLSEPCLNNNRLFWLESLAEEKGRTAIMMANLSGPEVEAPTCILPRPLSAKSRVHEYGGGSYCIDGDNLYFVLGEDQQVYHAYMGQPTFTPTCLTRTPTAPDNPSLHANPDRRFADITLDSQGQQLIAVCEQHYSDASQEPLTQLVSISLSQEPPIEMDVSVIAYGDDFYANPTLSPCGEYLSWLSWNHPNMPWDATELWLDKRALNGKFNKNYANHVAGNGQESLFQPRFAPNGDLFFVSDTNNWWNLYRIPYHSLLEKNVKPLPVTQETAECATPQWTFRMSTYDFLNEREILLTLTRNGSWSLALLTLNNNTITPIDAASSLSVITGISCDTRSANTTGVFVGASPTAMPSIYCLQDKKLHAITASGLTLSKKDISIPTAIEFPTGENHKAKAYGFYYPPTNAHFKNDNGVPPCIVICHGGPTGATENALNLKIQYWTNRGFSVVDVNYRGSTGYGRTFRRSLHQKWGVYDVEDVCSAANYAVSQGWANPNQLIIKGSSAGGYTVLAALTFSQTFNAGVSLYGIGDLETLVRDTHKFEARYLDSLIGDYTTHKQRYLDRSPIHFVNNISCPLLVFQGLEDKVVPPNQAETMVAAVKKKGLQVNYVTFENEGHGFRQAHNIKTMLDEELAFYKDIFNLKH